MREVISVYQNYLYPGGHRTRTLLTSMIENEVNEKLIDIYMKFLISHGFSGLEIVHEEVVDLESLRDYELCEDMGVTFITRLEKEIIESDWKSDMMRYFEFVDLYSEILEIVSLTDIDLDLKHHMKSMNDLNHLLDGKRNQLAIFGAYALKHPVFRPTERDSIIDTYRKKRELDREWKKRILLDE